MKPRNKAEKQPVDYHILSDIPANVDLNDLTEDLFLLDKQTRDKIIDNKELTAKSDGRIRKAELKSLTDLDIKYSIIKHDNQYYVLYKGLKQRKHKGVGASGVVKSMQNLQTGEWLTSKIISEKHRIYPGMNLFGGADFDETRKDYLDEFKENMDSGLGLGGDKPLPETTSKSKGKQVMLPMIEAGITLNTYFKKLVEKEIILHPLQVIDIFKQTAQALHQYHLKSGKVHRDIKPENILIDPRTGKVSIIDFGIAIKPTKPGEKSSLAGTMHTMAPEAWKKQVSQASDVFSFGATIALLVGMLYPRFQNSSLLVNFKKFDPQNKTVPVKDVKILEELHTLCDFLMAPDPLMRPSLPITIDQFNMMEKKVSTPFNVFIVDLEMFRTGSVEDRKVLLAQLKSSHEVVIVDTNSRDSKKEEAEFKFLLTENEGLRVYQKLFTGSEMSELKEAIKNDFTTLNPGIKYTFQEPFITEQKSIIEAKADSQGVISSTMIKKDEDVLLAKNKAALFTHPQQSSTVGSNHNLKSDKKPKA